MQAQETSPTTSPGPGNPTSSSPSCPSFDGETDQPSQSTDGGDMEAAVSFGSKDASISGDNEADTSWNSWRSKDSDETDVSHNSVKTKDSDHSAVSSVNTFASASESMGSQDVEVITSPTVSKGAGSRDQTSNDHRRSDSTFSTSAQPPNRYAYPDSYSETNPYVYPTSSAPSTDRRSHSTSLMKPSIPSFSTSNTPTNIKDEFSSNAASKPIHHTASNASDKITVPKPGIALRTRFNASIPIINPADRSVVRTPSMKTHELPPIEAGTAGLDRTLLAAKEETQTSGNRTVVPSPLPTPTDVGPTERRLEDNRLTSASSDDGEVNQAAYSFKPPINLSDLLAEAQARRVAAAAAAAAERDNAASVMSASSAESGKPSSTSTSTFKSPNVYINGLPPYFPEDELLALATPFGVVRSVRSFTRHVDIGNSLGGSSYGGNADAGIMIGGKKASGYGFVLFENVDAAERCIEGLKKFRNLHPSFSKQIHKIPGTPYTAMHSDSSRQSASGSQYDDDGDLEDEGPDSFKARMERLEDKSSTNLYIEGLPLSIDGQLLAALVSPHQIKSSRFFQTKLSHPPRIIAFVRLETRAGAEEVVERLHGRMVRGWNDAGSRISVRFADTSEQRELRRTERQMRQGQPADSSASKLTIAQAALLNLRGRDLQPALSPSLSSLSGSSSMASLVGRRATTTFSAAQRPTDFTSNAHLGFRQDYPSAIHQFNASMISPTFSTNGGPYTSAQLSDSLRGGYDAEDMNHDQRRQNYSRGHFGDAKTHTSAIAAEDALSGRYPVIGSGQRVDALASTEVSPFLGAGVTGIGMGLRGMGIGFPNRQQRQAFPTNGYTPTEEIILQAHRSRASQTRSTNFVRHGKGNGIVRDTGADTGNWVKGRSALPSKSGHRPAPSTYDHQEDDFHSNFRHNGRSLNDDVLPASSNNHLPDNSPQQSAGQQSHMRSTTVPNRSITAIRHQQHSSISNPHSTTQHNVAQQATTNSNKFLNMDVTNGHETKTNDSIQLSKQGNLHRQHQRTPSDSYKNDDRSNSAFRRGSRAMRADIRGQDSPDISPTLTCGSQTPSTLSPATPYFGSFSAQLDNLQNHKPVMHGGHVEMKNLNERRDGGLHSSGR
ncbi:hypothetical protein BDN71DRAFT_1510065 [Pleurotus eryngii]|uniref:RRM domain-containing protein n=1 Tax=Pleurotus eryngii TaxID=5323 RepID=A0A9P6DDT5_PLEER|nr:hypothetical protein BDN71DRAFT_1510065 [Pleurotus eryngii]